MRGQPEDPEDIGMTGEIPCNLRGRPRPAGSGQQAGGSEDKNQYRPWEETAETELEYFKRRYIESHAELMQAKSVQLVKLDGEVEWLQEKLRELSVICDGNNPSNAHALASARVRIEYALNRSNMRSERHLDAALHSEPAPAGVELELSDEELSALIEACNLARGIVSHCRPPWPQHGPAAHKKLIDLERRRTPVVRGKKTATEEEKESP